MSEKVRWGVLGVAKIATQKVIPAMQRGAFSKVVGIASRDLDKARHAAADLKIPKAYGSYEELLADPEIEAVYNPLPNHLHVPWSIRAAEAGKHVLCEKPIALSVAECHALIEARDRTGVKIGEVYSVDPHGNIAIANLQIDHQYSDIHRDATVYLRAHGLFGPKYIAIVAGTAGTPALPRRRSPRIRFRNRS